jgi:hypothetical protein
VERKIILSCCGRHPDGEREGLAAGGAGVGGGRVLVSWREGFAMILGGTLDGTQIVEGGASRLTSFPSFFF